MVKIAVAGGSGQVAREIIDALLATKRHEIVILSRKQPDSEVFADGLAWHKVDYEDKFGLGTTLAGVHTVLSFIQVMNDPGSKCQKNLIDAAIASGVKRFAPSEWASSSVIDMPWYAGKKVVREYLQKVNEKGKVLEYSLFQPGLFLDYLASPHKTAKHVEPLDTMFDIESRRAIIVDGHEPVITFTTVQDLANVVTQAIEYEGEWPVVGGIRGNRVAFSEILAIGERVRGGPFKVDKVRVDDLEAGLLNTSWMLERRHSAYAAEDVSDMLKSVLIGMLLSTTKGAWDVSDEFNQTLPDFEFTHIEKFLQSVWNGKP